MFDYYSGYRFVFRLVIYLSVFFIIGLLVDQLSLSLLIGAISLLLWHYRQLFKLQNWLWHQRKLTPPSSRGSWEGVFNGIFRLQRKNRKRVTQLALILSRFRQGAEALPDAAVVLDSEHNILWCNKLAQRLLGLVWPQDNGQRIDNLLRAPDFSQYLKQMDYSEPLEITTPQSDARVLEIRIIGYGEGQLLLIARDITRLRQLEVTRKEFVSNVSHELKTPLTVLQGYLEMMQSMAEPDSPNIRAMTLMQQQTTRMRSMVEQLLALSRIEDGVDDQNDTLIDMTQMMAILKDEAEALAAGKYQLDFEAQADLNLYGNELQLRSACSNLISNAIRYTEPQGKICVRWRRTATGGEFSVQDSGEGIEPLHIGRLTERFYRVDSARSRQSGGSGLGLAITKHVLTRHQSQLQICSEVGKGSQFSFVIPDALIEPKSTTSVMGSDDKEIA